jgi:DNA-binding transcriptional LysR family regulator
LVEERIDVSLRVGPQRNSNARLRLLGNVDFALVASQRFLRGRKIKLPAHLETVPSVLFAGEVTLEHIRLVRASQTVDVALHGNFRTNSSEGILAAAIAGLGFMVAPRWLVIDEIAKGTLEQILPAWKVSNLLPLYASFAENRTPPARVERFIEFFGKAFRADGLFVKERHLPMAALV